MELIQEACISFFVIKNANKQEITYLLENIVFRYYGYDWGFNNEKIKH